MSIQSIRIRNFRVLQDVHIRTLPKFAVLIGPHGSGKSTFVDVLSFLNDCVTRDVRFAIGKRGGFNAIVSRGYESENIVIEIKMKLDCLGNGSKRLVSYHLEISNDEQNISVAREFIKLRWNGRSGAPGRILSFQNGNGNAIENIGNIIEDGVSKNEQNPKKFSLSDSRLLAIKVMGGLEEFQVAGKICSLLEDINFIDLQVSDVKEDVRPGYAEHLSKTGKNLPNYIEFLKEQYPKILEEIQERMTLRVPEISNVSANSTNIGRVGLRFQDKMFEKPFFSNDISDGTVKVFAYLALLADPKPHSVICVEEPESHIYPRLLEVLAEEFQMYSRKQTQKGQVILTTQSPEFLNGVPLESVFYLPKKNGFSEVLAANDDEVIRSLCNDGDHPGWLWREGVFRGVNPI